MISFAAPIKRTPSELFYLPDGRLCVDYRHKQNDQFHTYAMDHATGVWSVVSAREQSTSAYGEHRPWEACLTTLECRDLGLNLVFNESQQLSTPGIWHLHTTLDPKENGWWRLTTSYEEASARYHQFKGKFYSYYSVRAYTTGVWITFVTNTIGRPDTLVAKVELGEDWWKRMPHPPGRVMTPVTDWTHYSNERPTDELFTSPVYCPDLTRHYMATTRFVLDRHGHRYEPPAGWTITTAACRQNVLVVGITNGSVNRIAKTGAPLSTLTPLVRSTPLPQATHVAFLDPTNLAEIKQMSFCPDRRSAKWKKPVDFGTFYLLAIAPDMTKVAMGGKYSVREFDID